MLQHALADYYLTRCMVAFDVSQVSRNAADATARSRAARAAGDRLAGTVQMAERAADRVRRHHGTWHGHERLRCHRLCLLDALENISAQQARRYYRKCGYCVEEPLSAEEVLRNAEAVLAQVDAANEFISNGWIAIAPPPQKQKQSHPPSEVHCLAEPEAWPLPLTARQSPRTCPPSPTPAF